MDVPWEIPWDIPWHIPWDVSWMSIGKSHVISHGIFHEMSNAIEIISAIFQVFWGLPEMARSGDVGKDLNPTYQWRWRGDAVRDKRVHQSGHCCNP